MVYAMNLILNERNGQYVMCEHEVENLEGEMILYIPEVNKIISLNETATFVWRLVVLAGEQKVDLSDIKLARTVIQFYECNENLFEAILNDVRDILNIFISESALVCQNESI